MVNKHSERHSTSIAIREMQVKVTLRCHPTHTRPEGCYPRNRNSVLGRMWRNRNPCALLVGMAGAAIVENRVKDPQRIEHKITISPISGNKHKRTESRDSNGYCILCSQQNPKWPKMETTRVSWWYKQNVIYTYDGILLLSLHKEGHCDTGYSMLNLEEVTWVEISQSPRRL